MPARSSALPCSALALALLASGCDSGKSPAPPAAPAADAVWRYQVARQGEVLGTIEVKTGEVGTLTPNSDSEEAKKLAEMWREIETTKSFSVSTEERSRGGDRSYGSRVYRVGDADYAESVHWKLLDENYEVEVLQRGT